jgi:hypothetical protein
VRKVAIFPPVAGLLAALASPAAAQAGDPAAECSAPRAATGELAPWRSPVTLVTANEVGQLPDAVMRVGQAAELVLHPIGAVRLPVAAGRAGGNGGLAAITITRTGTYRFALGSAGWVDVAAGGKAVKSTTHGHGPACTGIHKIVEFPLKPGRYTIVVSGNLGMRTQLLVARKP